MNGKCLRSSQFPSHDDSMCHSVRWYCLVCLSLAHPNKNKNKWLTQAQHVRWRSFQLVLWPVGDDIFVGKFQLENRIHRKKPWLSQDGKYSWIYNAWVDIKLRWRLYVIHMILPPNPRKHLTKEKKLYTEYFAFRILDRVFRRKIVHSKNMFFLVLTGSDSKCFGWHLNVRQVNF